MNRAGDFQPFLAELARRQAAAGMSGQRFAQHLGINQAVWSLVTRGVRKPSMAFVGAVLRQYPDMLNLFVDNVQIRTDKRATDTRGEAVA